MNEERIDIEIVDKVSEGPGKKIRFIADAARDAHGHVKNLIESLKGFDSRAVARLQADMTKATVETTRQQTATERLTAAQLRTATAAERLAVQTAKLATASAGAEVASQRLNTEQARTATASANAERAALRLTQAQEAGQRASKALSDAHVQQRDRLIDIGRAADSAAAAQARYNQQSGVSSGGGKSARESASVFVEAERSAKALRQMRAEIDPLYAAQRTYDNELQKANTLLAAGAISQKTYEQAVARSTERLNLMSGAHEKNAKAAGLNRMQLLTIQYTINDIIASAASGISPMTILMQQGGQVTQAWGGLIPTLKAAGGVLLSTAGIFAAVAAAGVGYLLFLDNAKKEVAGFQRALDATNGSAGLTAQTFMDMSDRIAASTKTSIAAARETALSYAGTGQLQKEQIEQLSAATANFAKQTGQTQGDVTKEWVKMLDGPSKFATEFAMHYNTLSVKQVEYIQQLEASGQKTQAVVQLSRDLYNQYGKEVPANLGYIVGAWNAVGRSISDAWTKLKQWGAGQSAVEKLASEQARVAKMEASLVGANKDSVAYQTQLRNIEAGKANIAVMEGQIAATEKKTAADAASAAQNRAGLQALEYFKKLSGDTMSSSERGKLAVQEYRNELEALRKTDPTSPTYLNALKNQAAAEAELMRKALGEKKASTAQAKQHYDDNLAIVRDYYSKENGLITQNQSQQERLLRAQRESNRISEGEYYAQSLALAVDTEKKQADLIAKTREDGLAALERSRAKIDPNKKGGTEALDKVNVETQKFNELIDTQTRSLKQTVEVRQELAKAELYKQFNNEAKAFDDLDNKIKAQNEALALTYQAREEAIGQTAAYNEGSRAAAKYTAGFTDELTKLEAGLVKLRRSGDDVAVELFKALAEGRPTEELQKTLNEILGKVDEFEKRLGVSKKKVADGAADAFAGAYDAKLLEGFEKNSKAAAEFIIDIWETSTETGGKAGVKKLRTWMTQYFLQEPLKMAIQGVLTGVQGSLLASVGSAVAGGGAGGAGGAAGGIMSLVSGGSSLASIFGYGGGIAGIGSSLGFGASTGLGMSLAGNAGAAFGMAGANIAGAGGAGTAAGLGMGIGAAIPYVAIAAVVANALGLFKSEKQTDVGIKGTLGTTSNVSGFTTIRKGGSLFSGPSYRDELSALPANTKKSIDDAVSAMYTGVEGMAKALGLNADALKTFTKDIFISTKDLSDTQIQEKLNAVFKGLGDDLANIVAGSVVETVTAGGEAAAAAAESTVRDWNGDLVPAFDTLNSATNTVAATTVKTSSLLTQYAKDGESAYDTLNRLASSLTTVNAVFKQTGAALFEASIKGADGASKLIDAFGGNDNFVKASASYYQNFYSESERTANVTRDLTAEFSAMGLQLPKNRDAYRALVDQYATGASLSTEKGRETYAMLIKLSETFASVTPEIVAANNAMEIAEKRRALDVQLLEAQGKSGEALALSRKYEYDALYALNPELADLQAHIWGLNDAAKVTSKRQQLEIALMRATGDESGALAEERAIEYAQIVALDPALGALATKLWEAEDAARAAAKAEAERAAAAQRAAAIEDTRYDYEQRILKAQGRTREALDLERGKEWARLQALSPALADMAVKLWLIEDAATAAAEAAQAQADAQDKRVKATDKAYAALEASIGAAKEAQQAIADAAKSAIDALKQIMTLTADAAKELYGEVEETKAQSVAAGNLAIQDALATLRSGGRVTDADSLSEAIASARGGLTRNNYASKVDEDFDRLVLAGKLKEISALTGKQLTFEEQTLANATAELERLDGILKAAQAQRDFARGTNVEIMSVADAVRNFEASLLAEIRGGGGAGGLSTRPTKDPLSGAVVGAGPSGAGGATSPYGRQSDGSYGTFDGYQTYTLSAERAASLAAVAAPFNGSGNLQGYYAAAKAAGYSLKDIAALHGASYTDAYRDALAAGIPAFADGGYHVGGMRLVGERGWEIAQAGPQQIFNQGQLADAFGMRGTEIVEALAQMIDEQYEIGRRTIELLISMESIVKKWDKQGMPPVRAAINDPAVATA